MELLDELPKKNTPGRHRRTARWAAEAEVLRHNPGKWGLLQSKARYAALGSGLAAGRYSAFTPPEEWEFAGRDSFVDTKGVRLADIYARYIGPNGIYGDGPMSHRGKPRKKKDTITQVSMQHPDPQSEQTDTPVEDQPEPVREATPEQSDPWAAFYNNNQ